MRIIEECVKLVGDKKRPTVGSCPEDPVCSSIFVYDQQDLTNVLENNLKEYEFFNRCRILVNDYNVVLFL
ncbi:unnamed protein product [Dracunculus medinensis]|uniref:Kinesin motor domain-containing protein n=1 Tax=Dracunculus medinensis TaxID=318479 RepID=A0A0N4US15_DRAME|nr:unnamed protein product [Dracunculus medinensis]